VLVGLPDATPNIAPPKGEYAALGRLGFALLSAPKAEIPGIGPLSFALLNPTYLGATFAQRADAAAHFRYILTAAPGFCCRSHRKRDVGK
jgi:hypothetical protein